MQASVSTGQPATATSSSVGGIANSASPAPGPGRQHQGAVHGFDARTGMGKIKGDDGATYSFFAAGVIGGVDLRVGQRVSFTDSDGVASKISVLADNVAASSSSIGGIANSTSAPVGAGRTMSGTVQSFDARTGMGKIKGSDGASYRFFSAGVIGKHPLAVGRRVEFTENDGVAAKIVPMRRGLWSLFRRK